MTAKLSVVVAGGGTAGHIEPALAVADAIKELEPSARVTALGTSRGLENKLVPERGYPLELIDPVPLPRKISPDLARVPLRLRKASRQARHVFDRVDADTLVGFGGYVSIPAYVAARTSRAARRIPVVVHEANARAGVANRVGARLADTVFTAVADCGIDGEVVGIPVRSSITSLDRQALRAQAREYFGLDPDAPTLLVFGGSQGAQSLNKAVSGAAESLAQKGIGVLHAHGPKNTLEVAVSNGPAYVSVPYISRMDLAYAAADLAVCRSGAMTVAELSATGLPAVYVPLPHGNGEQRLNALPVVAAGGAVIVEDKNLTSEWVSTGVGELMTIPGKLEAMSTAAAGMGHRNAAVVVATRALELAQQHARLRNR